MNSVLLHVCAADVIQSGGRPREDDQRKSNSNSREVHMFRGSVLLVVVAVFVVKIGLSPSDAQAGIAVTKATGTVFYEPFGNSEDPQGGTRTYTPKIPGSDDLVFLNGHVSQDSVGKASGGFSIDVRTIIDSNVTFGFGGPPPDCQSTFEMTFTTDKPVRYRFVASLIDQGPMFFRAKLDDITADARYDSLGQTSGSIPNDPDQGTFGTFLDEGTLAPGAHAFSVEAFGGENKGGAGGTAGTATLVVEAIPLPPAVGPGLAMLATLASVISFGRAHRRLAVHARA
jgi:hypothetical protein